MGGAVVSRNLPFRRERKPGAPLAPGAANAVEQFRSLIGALPRRFPGDFPEVVHRRDVTVRRLPHHTCGRRKEIFRGLVPIRGIALTELHRRNYTRVPCPTSRA